MKYVDLKWLQIPVPRPEEQTAITSFLDRETEKIDTLISKKERQIELLQEKRSALISQAVTKGLNPDVKMKDSGIEWLREIPEHWKTGSLRWIAKIYSGGTPDKSKFSYWTDGTIPWLNSGTVNQFSISEPSAFITEDAYKNSSAKWVPKGSLVVALAGQGKTKGMSAQTAIRTTCNQSMAAICIEPKWNARYILWWLTSQYKNIRGLAGDEKRDGLNLEMIGSISCPLPSKTEQTTIASFLDRETKKIDTLSEKINLSIEKLREYRTTLISAVVTGKIDVRGEVA